MTSGGTRTDLEGARGFGLDSARKSNRLRRPASESRFCRAPLNMRRGGWSEVLHTVDSLDVEGTEKRIAQVAQRLYQVRVGCLRAGGPLTEPLQKAGVRIVEFPNRGTLISFQSAYQLLRLAWFIRREKFFDVVHAHDLWANLTAVPAA